MGLLHFGRRADAFHHGAAADFKNNGGSTPFRFGYLPRGQLRAWRREAENRISYCTAFRSAGILAGVILAIGRIVGETAALLYPAGTAPQVADGLFSSGRTLAVHMYALLNEGLYTEQAYATAVVLLVLVVCINALSSFVAKKAGVKEK